MLARTRFLPVAAPASDLASACSNPEKSVSPRPTATSRAAWDRATHSAISPAPKWLLLRPSLDTFADPMSSPVVNLHVFTKSLPEAQAAPRGLKSSRDFLVA